MASVQLRDILSPQDRAAVMGLSRGPGQDQYLNSMQEIFAEADQEQRAMPHLRRARSAIGPWGEARRFALRNRPGPGTTRTLPPRRR